MRYDTGTRVILDSMTSFTTQELALPGVLHITPKRFADERGFSITTYDTEEFASLGITETFTKDYSSFSKKNVIRGFHFQTGVYAQAKLITCAVGSILQVVIDKDQKSPTFGSHVSVELSASVGNMLYIPAGYANGFCVLSYEGALVEYKISGAYHPESASGVRYNDPLFNVQWPVSDPIMSAQDQSLGFII